jgi:hypothetical protein
MAHCPLTEYILLDWTNHSKEAAILLPAPQQPRFGLVSPSNKVNNISVPIFDFPRVPVLQLEPQECESALHHSG